MLCRKVEWKFHTRFIVAKGWNKICIGRNSNHDGLQALIGHG